jgi:hypothetical protein
MNGYEVSAIIVAVSIAVWTLFAVYSILKSDYENSRWNDE